MTQISIPKSPIGQVSRCCRLNQLMKVFFFFFSARPFISVLELLNLADSDNDRGSKHVYSYLVRSLDFSLGNRSSIGPVNFLQRGQRQNRISATRSWAWGVCEAWHCHCLQNVLQPTPRPDSRVGVWQLQGPLNNSRSPSNAFPSPFLGEGFPY